MTEKGKSVATSLGPSALPAWRESGVQAASFHGDGISEEHVFGRRGECLAMGKGGVDALLLQSFEGSVA